MRKLVSTKKSIYNEIDNSVGHDKHNKFIYSLSFPFSKQLNKKTKFLIVPGATFLPDKLGEKNIGKNFYGIWRQSLDKRQSIFCISNLTDESVKLSLLDLNLIGFDHWQDLITKIEVDETVESDEAVSNSVTTVQEVLGDMMGDAPACYDCGHITIRNGSCYKCLNCGNSLGCS